MLDQRLQLLRDKLSRLITWTSQRPSMGARAASKTKMRLECNSSSQRRILSLVVENNTREIGKRNGSIIRLQLRTLLVVLNPVRVVSPIMRRSHLQMLLWQVRHNSKTRFHFKVMDRIKASPHIRVAILTSTLMWSRSRKFSKRTQMPGSSKRTKEWSYKMGFLRHPYWKVHRSELLWRDSLRMLKTLKMCISLNMLRCISNWLICNLRWKRLSCTVTSLRHRLKT